MRTSVGTPTPIKRSPGKSPLSVSVMLYTYGSSHASAIDSRFAATPISSAQKPTRQTPVPKKQAALVLRATSSGSTSSPVRAFVCRTPYAALSDGVKAHYRQHITNLLHIHRSKRAMERAVLTTRAVQRWRHAVEQTHTIQKTTNATRWQVVAAKFCLRRDYRWAICRWREALPLFPESRMMIQNRQQQRTTALCAVFNSIRRYTRLIAARAFARWHTLSAHGRSGDTERALRDQIGEYEDLMLALSADVESRLVASGKVGSIFQLAQGAVVPKDEAGEETKGSARPAAQRRAYVWPHPGEAMAGRPAVYNSLGKPVPRRPPRTITNDDWSLW